jgi:excisionase family DNA binding protein
LSLPETNLTLDPAPDRPILLSRKQTARMLNISERKLDLLIRDGSLQGMRVGKYVHIELASVEAFIKSNRLVVA